jgi:hypothetical protein
MTMRHVNSLIATILRTPGERKATKYLSPKDVVTVALRRYRGRVSTKGTNEFVVKIGRPNYRERLFVKACRKAGEPFPMRKVQITIAQKRKA